MIPETAAGSWSKIRETGDTGGVAKLAEDVGSQTDLGGDSAKSRLVRYEDGRHTQPAKSLTPGSTAVTGDGKKYPGRPNTRVDTVCFTGRPGLRITGVNVLRIRARWSRGR